MHANPWSARLQKRELLLNQKVLRWTQRLERHRTWRLSAGLLLFLSFLPAALRIQSHLVVLIPAGLTLLFLILVFRTRQLSKHTQNLTHLLQFLRRQKNRTLGLPSGRYWQDAQATSATLSLPRDLGLFGEHSLWTLVDETLSEGGRQLLLKNISQHPPTAEKVRARQKQIQNLRNLTWFYTRLCLQVDSNDVNLSTLRIQESLMSTFVEKNFNTALVLNVATWTFTAAFAFYDVVTQAHWPPFGYLLFPVVSFSSQKYVAQAFAKGVGLSHHLGLLAPTLAHIEERAVRQQALRDLCPTLTDTRPSKSTRRLDTLLGFVGTQTNPLLHILLNLFLPWRLVSVFFLERLRRQMAKSFPQVVHELAEFEITGSLLIFDRYQTKSYPLVQDQLEFKCEQIFHPLIPRERAIANDFTFLQGKSLGLLTGSNMSGKSTFLRTIGVNQILANLGAPVFANKMVTTPFRIETCIEVTDSLRDGYSYFYAEVRRLRDLLSAAKQAAPCMFLIDEIFRGTNNRERQIGSRAVIQTLAREPSALGLISTHDLELTTLADTQSSVLNLHFREDINQQGQMVFSYQLRPGPCTTTNALRIMKAEGIQVEIEGEPKNFVSN